MLAIEDMMRNRITITMPTHLMHADIGTCKRKRITCTPCTPSRVRANASNAWRRLARALVQRRRRHLAFVAAVPVRGRGGSHACLYAAAAVARPRACAPAPGSNEKEGSFQNSSS